MAPVGASRETLAQAIARKAELQLVPIWHVQSEPSRVEGMPHFHNLTQGFEVRNEDEWVVRCVDDITLQEGLQRTAPPKPGWFRIVSDDLRLLRLVRRHTPVMGSILKALAPVAHLFGGEPEANTSGIVRVSDSHSASVCLGAPLPGERERPCELVTKPLSDNQWALLSDWLTTANDLGFSLPTEAAVHVHCDATLLRDAAVFQRLIRLWTRHGARFKEIVRTNPRCMRLGDWPTALHTAVEHPEFPKRPWPDAQAQLRDVGLTKFCDLNVANLVLDIPNKPTVEFRTFPGSKDPTTITAFAHLAAAFCQAAVDGQDAIDPLDLPTLHPAARAVLLHPSRSAP